MGSTPKTPAASNPLGNKRQLHQGEIRSEAAFQVPVIREIDRNEYGEIMAEGNLRSSSAETISIMHDKPDYTTATI
jgi:hypothetical protein